LSAPVPDSNQQVTQKQKENVRTVLFMVALSFLCAIILSVLASALAEPKETAKNLDRNKQMLIAAKILDHQGHFLVLDAHGHSVPAAYSSSGQLVPFSPPVTAAKNQIMQVYKSRVIPLLVDQDGELKTFKEAGVNEEEYMAKYKKTGYYKTPLKLIYKVLPNSTSAQESKPEQAEAYVIPVNGMGLWDAIYGYLAVKPDGNHVMGATWYDQKETPGLGANMAEAAWQSQFPGKQIFQAGADEKINVKTAPIGIVVVKGKVSEVLGNAPKSKSAVDGMTGATLTGNGITDAYKNVLNAYRPFLVKLYKAAEQAKSNPKP
jgi:Na+-transporting NADH:ubiquinone oxidoreductase subunit C